MSTPTLITDPAVLGDLTPLGADAMPVTEASGVSRRLLGGTAVLGASVMVERGTGFLANILAARFAGAGVFGAYALGISTANNISTYAAGGIGATATRFSGKYNEENGGYATFARVLAVVALTSAAVAALALWAGAGPIANLLHKPELTGLLRWAALSAAGMIVLECARGFFVGQRRLQALGALSLLVGLGMVLLLPAVSLVHRATTMVMVQGCITVGAVLLCVLLARPLRLAATPSNGAGLAFRPMLREVWGFGLVQLMGLLSANLAGWWLTALVARGDTTLVQMGFFAIASQLRNLTGIVPALLTESSYAVMAGEDSSTSSLPDRVMALCTYASILVSYALAGLGMIVVPWLLHLLYGQRYRDAAVAAAVAMGVAVIQMGNSPPSARMSIVSVRWVAAGNTCWALAVAGAGSLWMWHGGSATQAMVVFFAGHVLLSVLVFAILWRHGHLPEGVVSLFLLSTIGMAVLAALAAARAAQPQHQAVWSIIMLAVFLASSAALLLLGKQKNWMVALERPLAVARQAVQRLTGGRLSNRGAGL